MRYLLSLFVLTIATFVCNATPNAYAAPSEITINTSELLVADEGGFLIIGQGRVGPSAQTSDDTKITRGSVQGHGGLAYTISGSSITFNTSKLPSGTYTIVVYNDRNQKYIGTFSKK